MKGKKPDFEIRPVNISLSINIITRPVSIYFLNNKPPALKENTAFSMN